MSARNPAPTVRTTLNRDYIAAVAVSVVDEQGMDGFSMRKLGAALGADPMAVYRHYTDQQDLFDGIAAYMFAELDMESLPWQEDWRELLRAYADRLRSTLRKHPNAVPIFATRQVHSPSAVETGTWMVETLQAAGFSPAVAPQLTRCLREYVIGHILSRAIATVTAERTGEAPLAGLDADHFQLGLTALLDGFGNLRTV
ncbi:TetR/AcrR family transcriptional regulator [Nocardia sp. NPDC049149]|uniref:TetR/AcrR family transcriptional regulator n=1 Tax=Nocardia sp. NPDC049149 TaxID=3364315 RepID=UPI003719875D